jgi:capping protein beta
VNLLLLQPLKAMKCPDTNKPFIVCDYNRDGDSFRSPWSNKYTPPLDDGIVPPENLRRLEIAANDAFDQYREQYYEGGISSCYFWDNEGGFACCLAIKKESEAKASPLPEGADPKTATVSSGGWNSIHVVEARVSAAEKKCQYKLTTTVMLTLDSSCEAYASTSDICGHLTRSNEREKPIRDESSHVANIGEMVEEMEGRMRDAIYEVSLFDVRLLVLWRHAPVPSSSLAC